MVPSKRFSIKYIFFCVIVLLIMMLLLLLDRIISAPLVPLLSYLPYARAQLLSSLPSVKDPDFVVEEFIPNISQPTSIAFVSDPGDKDDMALLILQKNDGTVRVARNGNLADHPALDVNVANKGEQGMLGIGATAGHDNAVYLYFTESERDGGEAISKRVYRYTWDGVELVDPVLVKDLPATQSYHNGGAMATGPDGTIYLVVGDTGRYGILQNHIGGDLYPDTSVIMPIEPQGAYYAIGIRNSFGLAFDPVTGKLWETENGNDDFDEINLVEPGFNSGWQAVMGPATESDLAKLVDYGDYVYADPKFSWQRIVAPTGLTFIDSGSMSKYNDSLFAGDCNNGNIYKFRLNEKRDGFVFADSTLSDKVANLDDSLSEIIFGENFGCVTDLDIGPDGLLYVTSHTSNAIFRLVPRSMAAGEGDLFRVIGAGIPSPYIIATIAGIGIIATVATLAYRRKTRNFRQD
jgi:aldose sugar dehydrogenase